ncbi:GHKL domain-containing protein [Aneurinibacillus sp. BA2021]|nr:GHKL domain-containing protein [Aneurinibacillus sp. BA2021]
MIRHVEGTLLQEKEQKLFSIAQQLDMMMPGTYDSYLPSAERQLTRDEKIVRLHDALAASTEEIAKRNPGIGVGYYAKDLNAIITYGPEQEMHGKVGVSIDLQHPGRQVLATGKPLVYTGPQVRGDIMNAMVPLLRDGSVIGYVWANETTSSVSAQLTRMERKLFLLLGAGLLFSITASFIIANRVGGAIDTMIASIEETRTDFRTRMPDIRGVLGAIPSAFNALMDRLLASQEQNRVLEESMRRADRMQSLGRMATGMAHEIRNPLASIKAFAQIMEEGMAPNDTNRDYLHIILKETDRLNQLVEHMLQFGKPSPGKEEMINLAALIQHCLVLVEHECRRKRVALLSDVQPAFLRADSGLIEQVLINVLLNAIQAVPEDGCIRMIATEEKEHIRLSVFNTGTAIPEENQQAVFHPFFTTKERGSGLGLSVTQNIVHLYHGTIEFINHTDGVEFIISFPKTREEA